MLVVVLVVTAGCGSREAPVARDGEVHRQGTEDATGSGDPEAPADAGTGEIRVPDAQVDAPPLDAQIVDAPRTARDAGVDAAVRPRAVDAAVRDAAVIDAVGPDAAVPDAAAAAKADIKDVGEPGEAVTLVPVAGKVTVFDFHASWCTPCKEVDRELAALAKANPDRVAIRRIDIEDMDTPGAEKHLVPGGFALPHLKVYDASKRKVLELSASSGGIAGLMAKVRALVDGN